MNLDETLYDSRYSCEQADKYWDITDADMEANIQQLRDHYVHSRLWRHTPCLLPSMCSRDGSWELCHIIDEDERRIIAAERKLWRAQMQEDDNIAT